MTVSKAKEDKVPKTFSGELELVSLKDVSVEERRREADKPLYLARC